MFFSMSRHVGSVLVNGLIGFCLDVGVYSETLASPVRRLSPIKYGRYRRLFLPVARFQRSDFVVYRVCVRRQVDGRTNPRRSRERN